MGYLDTIVELKSSTRGLAPLGHVDAYVLFAKIISTRRKKTQPSIFFIK